MANIASYLEKIKAAIYGEEVRGSIHDAIQAMNAESSSAMEFASTAKDSAQASASTAAQKAGEASASAEAAKASETIVAANAAEAKASEIAAKQSETAAKASETAAANSEAAATQKASEAASSASAAAQSAAEAKTAENNARLIRSEMETLGAQATADKEAAEAAKDAAEAARDAAETSRNTASDLTNTALAAQTAAEAARDDAQAAAASADQDANDAEAAKAAALAAQTAAEAARDDAASSSKSAADSALSAKQYSGKPPQPIDGTWRIWDADKQEYFDSGISCELVGPTGNGIKDIQLTSGNHTPGTTDIYTVTMTDESTFNISVYNGRNGTGAGDVLGIWFDLILPASGWADGKITIANEHLLALATHKYFIGADEASRDEYLDCNVRPKDITTTGFITFENDTDPTEDIIVNVVRFELSANGTP